MSGTIPKCYRDAASAARKARWTITLTGANHLRWKPPEGRPVITASTPPGYGDGIQSDLAKLRAAGLVFGKAKSRRRPPTTTEDDHDERAAEDRARALHAEAG